MCATGMLFLKKAEDVTFIDRQDRGTTRRVLKHYNNRLSGRRESETVDIHCHTPAICVKNDKNHLTRHYRLQFLEPTLVLTMLSQVSRHIMPHLLL